MVEGCSHVRQHVSGCLPEKSGGGGTKSLTMNDLATDICLWSEKRGMTLVPCYLLGHLKVLADHLSRRGQILKTDWSLNQTVADRIFRVWGRPFVDLFALGKNTKLAIYVSPIREETSWKVDNLVQNWNGSYSAVYSYIIRVSSLQNVFALISQKRCMLWPKFIWNTYSKSYMVS